MEDTITIVLTDAIVAQLKQMDIDPEVNKKLKIWFLKDRKEQLQSELSSLNEELLGLRK